MVYFCVFFHCFTTEALGTWICNSVEESDSKEAVHSLCFLGFWLFFLEGNKKDRLPCLVATLIQVLKGIRSGSSPPCCVVFQPHSADHWDSVVYLNIFSFFLLHPSGLQSV